MIFNDLSRFLILSNNTVDMQTMQNLYKESVIVIHLHYAEKFEKIMSYLDSIPSEITVLFTASNNQIKEKILSYIDKKANCKLIEKQNRGRDISSWLVACRKEILKYKYFCFLHDKKEKAPCMQQDVDRWVKSLWQNMIGNKSIIDNILITLSSEQKLGLLIPPIIFGNYLSLAFENPWYADYANCVKLAKRLSIDANIDEKKYPMATGTVFWCKTDALSKILKYNWKYEDFDEEPLPNDGTISHAVERIIEFVAIDKGYVCKWVCANFYAEKLLDEYYSITNRAFLILRETSQIKNINTLIKVSEFIEKIKQVSSYIYIYGAGVVAKRCFEYLQTINYMPKGFIVTQKDCETANGLPMWDLEEVAIDENSLIIVAVSNKYKEEILNSLKKHGISEENILYFGT